jgi:hypothetical protein
LFAFLYLKLALFVVEIVGCELRQNVGKYSGGLWVVLVVVPVGESLSGSAMSVQIRVQNNRVLKLKLSH